MKNNRIDVKVLEAVLQDKIRVYKAGKRWTYTYVPDDCNCHIRPIFLSHHRSMANAAVAAFRHLGKKLL